MEMLMGGPYEWPKAVKDALAIEKAHVVLLAGILIKPVMGSEGELMCTGCAMVTLEIRVTWGKNTLHRFD